MATGAYPLSNSLHREVGTSQPEKRQLKNITIAAQLLDPSGIVLSRQGSLESESLSLLGEFMQSSQHHASGWQGYAGGIETRKAERDWVSIHVFEHTQLITQKKRCKSSFSRSVWSGN